MKKYTSTTVIEAAFWGFVIGAVSATIAAWLIVKEVQALGI